MEFIIQDPTKIEIFTTVFHNLKLLTDNVCLRINKDKLFVQTMDASKVSILEIHISTRWFDHFVYKKDSNIGINTNIFSKILSCKDKTQQIVIQYDEAVDGDKLNINMENVDSQQTQTQQTQQITKGSTYRRHFEIPLVSIDDEDILEIPSAEYEAEISLPSSNFAVLVGQLKTFGNIFQIDCDENKVLFTSKSLESGSMRVDIPIDDLTGFSIVEGELIRASFGLQYTNYVCSCSKLSRNVELKIKREHPLKIEYVLDNLFQIQYLIAPVMDDS